MPENEEAEQSPGAVLMIMSTYHSHDADNRPTSEDILLEEEGWFADRTSADRRVEELNARTDALYNTEVDRLRRAHEQKTRAAKQHNREAAAIRAAGMRKADVPVPAPFEPPTKERVLAHTSYTAYEVIKVERSELDALAAAKAT